MRLILVLIILLLGSCTYETVNKASVFFYAPQTQKQIQSADYKPVFGDIYKRNVADTSERIEIVNLKKGIIRKDLYINNTNLDNKPIIDLIIKDVDTVIYNANPFLIVEYHNVPYFIFYGFSGTKKYSSLSIYDLRENSFRKFAVKTMDEVLEQTTLLNKDSIDKGLKYIESLPGF